MGTKWAPVYATLVVAFLEVKLYQKFEARFGEEHRKKNLKMNGYDTWMTVSSIGTLHSVMRINFTKF